MHIKNQRRTVAAALVLASAGLALAPAVDASAARRLIPRGGRAKRLISGAWPPRPTTHSQTRLREVVRVAHACC